uniref:inositol-polyphosphate 5-phosphatase n=1 Tax=Acrobeloides nanus TaxID=290746 RepID=A0A914C552_9BILA
MFYHFSMKDCLLITANVGSIFEEPLIRKSWIKQIINTIFKEHAKFVAIHFQESGGKNYQKSSHEVPGLVQHLCELLPEYDCCRAFLDLEFANIETYTALSAVIFVHNSAVNDVKQYNFKQRRFCDISKKPLIVENHLSKCEFVVKEKFPRSFWLEFRWGRKGFLHTRWSFEGKVIDLINIHLFHDESNLAIRENPALYSENRRKAMNFTLTQYENFAAQHGVGCLFVFGDFNFRLNADSLLKKITENADPNEELEINSVEGDLDESVSDTSSHSIGVNGLLVENPDTGVSLRRHLSAIEFRVNDDETARDRSPSSCILRIEKKRFDYVDHDKFVTDWNMYREDDWEPALYPLQELDIKFPPT